MPNEVETPDVTPSLGDALSAALERQSLVPPAAAESPAPVSRPASADDTAAAVPGPRTDGRDEHGRFKPKDPNAAPAAAPSVSPTSAPGAAAGAAPPTAPAAAEAPASWRDDIKPLYAALPESVKQYVHQRENELQDGFRRVSQRAGVAEAVLGEFAPYEQILASEKATPIDAIRTLLQTAHALRTGGPEYKKAIILGLVQQYGVDMSTELNPQMARTEAELSRLSQEKMYGQASVQQQNSQQAVQELEAFSNDPANEFFPQVRQIMGGLVGQGYAKTLKEAYDMATGMHPEVRQKLWDRAVASNTQTPRKRAAANMSVTNSPAGNMVVDNTGGKKDNSVRASIEGALGALGEG